MSADRHPRYKADNYEGSVFYDGLRLGETCQTLLLANYPFQKSLLEYPYRVSVQGRDAIITARLARHDRDGGGATALARALTADYYAIRDSGPPHLEWSWEGQDERQPGYPQVVFVLPNSLWGGLPLTRYFRRRPHPRAIFNQIVKAQEVLWAAMDDTRRLHGLLEAVKFAHSERPS